MALSELGVPSAETRPSRGDLALCALVVAVITLPFLDKPFHIDDPFILERAHVIAQTPLDPYRGESRWLGRALPVWDQATNPPGMSYVLAPLLSFGGDGRGTDEVVLHLAMIPFYALLAFATIWLVRRFCGADPTPALFVLTSAAVVVSGNLMRDVPATALGVAGVALVVSGTDRSRHGPVSIGALLIGASLLMKYSMAVFLVVGALYPLLRGRARFAGWIGLSLAILAIWCAHNLAVHGEPHLTKLLRGSLAGNRGALDRAFGLVVVVGSMLYLAPILVWSSLRERRLREGAAVGVGAVVWLASAHLYYGGRVDLEYALWCASGVACLGILATRGAGELVAWIRHPRVDPRSDTAFLIAWALGPILMSVIFVPFQAVRHLLPALVPIAILAFRFAWGADQVPDLGRAGARGSGRPETLASGRAGARGSGDAGTRASGRVVARVSLLVQSTVCALVALADYDYAATYRDIVREIPRDGAHGRPMWYVGSWGFALYAERADLAQLRPDGPVPDEGDSVVWPDVVAKGFAEPLKPHLEPRRERRFVSTSPLRTMNAKIGAGFYGLFTNPGWPVSLPYRIAPAEPLETFYLTTFHRDTSWIGSARAASDADDRDAERQIEALE